MRNVLILSLTDRYRTNLCNAELVRQINNDDNYNIGLTLNQCVRILGNRIIAAEVNMCHRLTTRGKFVLRRQRFIDRPAESFMTSR